MAKKTFQLDRTDTYRYEIPKSDDMHVPARLYSDEAGVQELTSGASGEWSALQQLVNVACLPGIQKAALAMADIHPGYGFPIGGIGAFDPKDGVISVAGVGFDINCGVRSMRTMLTRQELSGKEELLADKLLEHVPAGLGSTGELRLNHKEIDKVLERGASYAVGLGYGRPDDLEYIESSGKLEGADPTAVSKTAKQRQMAQVGTLGSGNHYVEVQYVDEVFDEAAAEAYGLQEGQITIMLHTGSRALGHQIGTDYLKTLEQASKKYKIPIRERELVCAPINSPEGKQYYSAVMAGANCAFANRQVLTHLIREAFEDALGTPPEEIETLYEIAHNTVKFEEHEVDGERKKLLVHRKGATRAFGPGRDEIPGRYRHVGQPVLVGGTMGTSSYILKGTDLGMAESFGSALHGAGRAMSRRAAKKQYPAKDVANRMKQLGITVRAHGRHAISEEAPGAYKDIEDVINVMHGSGIVEKVVRLKPIVCLKG
jgi:tRNA-splicing ligase RtcB (3'-phosphate/5'-hydroxy nucleic acid ligase)